MSARLHLSRRVLLVAATALLALAATAPAALADPSPRVYVVVIDGLEDGHVEDGKAPFIASMLDGQGANATYFPDSTSVIPAETNPNHTAMMSGAYPGRSGIPGNAFALYAPLVDEDTCETTGPFDFRSPPNETSGENRTCALAEFTFEAIRRQGNPNGVFTAGIFGKPKLGRIFAGENFQPGMRDVDYLWAPCSSGPDDDEYCADVPTNPITGYAIDDNTVMDAVIESITDGVRSNRGDAPAGPPVRPDLTFVNLQQVDSAGHATGVSSVYDEAIAMADDEIQRLVTTLRDRGEWERSVLIVLSDHGMDTTPEKTTLTDVLTDGGIPEDTFTIVQNGSFDAIYLNDRLDPGRHELLRRMREILAATDGVAEALYREPNPADGGDAHTVEGVHPGWNSAGERSGDLLVTSDPGTAFSDPGQFSNPLPGNHGAPQTADNFLAVFGGGALVEQGVAGTHGEARPARSGGGVNVDLASTAMGLLGLFPTRDDAGSFLADAFDRGELRRLAAPPRPEVRISRAKRGGGKTLPGAKGARGKKVSYRIVIRPKGGSYDVQASKRKGAVRKPRRWRKLAKGSERASLRVRGIRGRKYRFRVRTRSAADIPGQWTFKAPRLR